MTSGNLATTQAVVSKIEERFKLPSERHNCVLEAATMFQMAGIVGKTLRETISERDADVGPQAAGQFGATLILPVRSRGRSRACS
jgi:putative proteasome-type protease